MHCNLRNYLLKKLIKKTTLFGKHSFFMMGKFSDNFLLSGTLYLLIDVHFSAVFL